MSTEWAYADPTFRPTTHLRNDLESADPDDPLLDYNWNAVLLAEYVALYSDEPAHLVTYLREAADEIQRKIDTAEKAGAAIEGQTCLRVLDFGQAREISLGQLVNDYGYSEAVLMDLDALPGGGAWADRKRAAEIGPRGYREIVVTDKEVFTRQLEEYFDARQAAKREALDTVLNLLRLNLMNTDGVFGIILDRGRIDIDQIRALSESQITDLYNRFVGPAIDSIENVIAHRD